MSNILIIKHGSLGDIVQISGVIRDIRETHKNNKIFILTTIPYVELFSKCPFIDGVLIDKRLPRWNLSYLIKLKKSIKNLNFSHVYDLQNSSRTSFYRKYLFNISKWSSAETTLKPSTKKKDFNHEPVLDRFKLQLENSNIVTKYSLTPDFGWACVNVDHIVKKYFQKKYILFFPFCSPELSHKKWPYYNELIRTIKSKHKNINMAIVPGPKELDEARKIDIISITNNQDSVNLTQLAGLIKNSSYVIANDTGPAHMAAHLGIKGIVLFGHHTTPKKVSIETENFKALCVDNLNNLSAEKVYDEIQNELKII